MTHRATYHVLLWESGITFCRSFSALAVFRRGRLPSDCFVVWISSYMLSVTYYRIGDSGRPPIETVLGILSSSIVSICGRTLSILYGPDVWRSNLL